MSETIFRPGYPHSLMQPMYDQGFGITPGMVYPDFAAALLQELKDDGQYADHNAVIGRGPDVHHNDAILGDLYRLPRLAEYLTSLNTTICEVSEYNRNHLTYLTVRACPAFEQMSTNIHRNDNLAGPWLVALTVAGSGSFMIYDQDQLPQGQEIVLTDNRAKDPMPRQESPMKTGDAWGIYSLDESAPHAGGPNTSQEPKILILLYGWGVRQQYLRHARRQGQAHNRWQPPELLSEWE